MPYIKRDLRDEVGHNLQQLAESIVTASRMDLSAVPGILNFCITVLIKECYARIRNNKLTYADYNSAIGLLECAKLEFYRRGAAPYEDEKIQENGDV